MGHLDPDESVGRDGAICVGGYGWVRRRRMGAVSLGGGCGLRRDVRYGEPATVEVRWFVRVEDDYDVEPGQAFGVIPVCYGGCEVVFVGVAPEGGWVVDVPDWHLGAGFGREGLC